MSTRLHLLVVVLAALAALALPDRPAWGRPRYYGGRVYAGNGMPGWDWWRTYPWSPYNYGRNPYNPAWNPYPYAYPYPYPASYPYSVYTSPPAGGYSSSYQSPASGAGESFTRDMIPDVSGPVSGPPAGAALIRLYVPDRWANVWFDGVKTDSIGTVRYYVTPDLEGPGPFTYEVAARWNRNGQPVTEERKINVSPGQTVVVDFSHAMQGRGQ